MSHMDRERRPSVQLNKAFTGVVEGYNRQISPQWLADTHFPHRDIRTYTPTEGIFIGMAPDVYSKAPLSLTQQGTQQQQLIAPVGAYGSAWTEKLLGATTKLIREASDDRSTVALGDPLTDFTKEQGSAAINYTYHGTNMVDDLTGSVQRTFIEGQGQTSLYAAGLLTMQTVEGFATPQSLLDKLIADGVFSHLSLVIPPNTMEKMARSGTVLKDPVMREMQSDGTVTLRLREGIVRHWYEKRDAYDQSTGGAPLDVRGCPVGRKIEKGRTTGVDTGMQLLADTVRGGRMQQQEPKREAIVSETDKMTPQERQLRTFYREAFPLAQGRPTLQGYIFAYAERKGFFEGIVLPETIPDYLASISIPKKHLRTTPEGEALVKQEIYDLMRENADKETTYAYPDANLIYAITDELLQRELRFQLKGREGRPENATTVTPDSPSDPYKSFLRHHVISGVSTGVAVLDQMVGDIRETLEEDINVVQKATRLVPMTTRQSDLFDLRLKWEDSHPGQQFAPEGWGKDEPEMSQKEKGVHLGAEHALPQRKTLFFGVGQGEMQLDPEMRQRIRAKMHNFDEYGR